MHGTLIAICGTDGSGKSTQVRLLVASLNAAGYRSIRIWSRAGHTPLLNNIRKVAHFQKGKHNTKAQSPEPRIDPKPSKKRGVLRSMIERLYVALSIVDITRLYAVRLRWMLRRHDVIVCDRYLWDALVDFGGRFPHYQVEQWVLWRLALFLSPTPDATYFLQTSVQVAQQRLIASNDPLSEYPIDLGKRLAHYEKLATQLSWNILDGEEDIDELAKHIQTRVLEFVAVRNASARS